MNEGTVGEEALVRGDATTPERVKLVVDLAAERLEAGSVSRSLAGPSPTPDQVLAIYLSLVYTLRNAEPGTPLTLRRGDLDVLAEVLRLGQPDVTRRLADLMAEPDGEVRRGTERLRRRVLLPVAGIVVAVTALGALVLVVDRDGAAPPPPPAAVGDTGVRLGSPQVAERGPDGEVVQTERRGG